MHAVAKSGCGIYCLRDPRSRAQPRPPLRGYGAPGNRPTCAGLRPLGFLGLFYHSTELGTGFWTARATVSPATDLAPASRNALEQASSVAPDVNTLSTSKTR